MTEKTKHTLAMVVGLICGSILLIAARSYHSPGHTVGAVKEGFQAGVIGGAIGYGLTRFVLVFFRRPKPDENKSGQ